MIPPLTYIRPESLKDAVKQLGSDGARIHAGGTDLLGCLHDQVFSARKLVSLSALPDLRGITRTGDGGRRLGALATITEIAQNPDLRNHYPALPQAAGEVASPQLRNQGTLGGNLCQKPRCWYYRGEFDCLRKGGPKCYAFKGQNQFHCILGGAGCYIVHPSDTAPALIALGAKLEIAGPKGRRNLPLEDFHVLPKTDPRQETALAPDEVLTAVILPPPQKGQLSSYRKVRARQSWDFAVAGCAIVLNLESNIVKESRIVLSGAAPVPWRARETETELRGTELTVEAVSRIAAAAVAEARPLEHNGYKVPLFKGLIEEELLKMVRQ